MNGNRRQFIKNAGFALAGALLFPYHRSFGGILSKDSHTALSDYKLDRVEILELDFHWARHVGRNGRIGIHGQHHKSVVARIHTDRGASGWGLTHRSVVKNSEALIGKKISDLIHPATGILPNVTRDLDIALFDLAGNILDMPVYKMLGAKGTMQTPLYSGMIYFDELDADGKFSGWDTILNNCEWDINYGYRQLKVKIGRSGRWYPHAEGLAKDIEIVNLIYNKFKDKGVEILVDANDMYSLEDTVTFLEGVKGVPLFWVEEPFVENIAESRELRNWMNKNGYKKTFYADGEFSPDLDLMKSLIEDKSIDIHLVDVFDYGFTRWLILYQWLKSQGAMGSPHAWGDRLKTNYTVHLAAGLGNIPTIEGVTCFSDAIDYGDYRLIDGMISPSEAPGFGMKLLV